MKILYKKTVSAEKKQLIAAISKFTGDPSKYMGPPKMFYRIGELIIDREGNLVVPDEMDVTALVEALKEQGFEGAVERTVQVENTTDTTPVATPAEETVTEPAVAPTEAPASEQEALAPETPTAEPMGFSISIPKSKLPADAVEKLEKILDSKSGLILKALGAANLKVETDAEKVTFPWFDRIPEDDQVEAYTKFIAALCKMAREQKRVSAKEKPNDNEKYAFRCFLLRLGFIGDGFKNDRKILLKNFHGSSAFRTQESADKAKEKLEAKKADSTSEEGESNGEM